MRASGEMALTQLFPRDKPEQCIWDGANEISQANRERQFNMISN